MKRRPRITIRAMLLVLVLLGVGVVVALSAAGFHSNGKLIDSQNRLVEVMLPLQDASREIETVVRGFILHQARIEAAPGLRELDVLACRAPLETAFRKARERVESLGDQAPDSRPGLRKLMELYGPFLEKENRLEALKRDSLELERSLNARMDRLDAVVKDLQDNAEAVSGKVNFAGLKDIMALKRQLARSDDPEGLRTAAAALVDNDLARTQKTCNDLSLAVADLATHGRLLVLCTTPDQLQSLRANRIAQAVRLMVVSLESLAGRVEGNAELAGIIQKLNTDAAEVQSVLLQADDSIAALASRSLDNQKQMAEIRAGFEKDAAEMNRQGASLASLSSRLLREAEDQNETVREDTARFVGSISVLAVVFLFVSGWWITRRISVPVGKASRFADILAQGDFTAEIELSSNDEMGDLVHKLRMMAESLNELLIQVTQAGIQVASSSMELAATAKQQEATVRHQVESTGKVEESVERISGVMGDLVHTMEQMTVASQESEWKKDDMGDLARMEQAMRNMDSASKAISVKLAAISEKMENITSVVTTITKVAEQTNLLSLNAAIEAEKAGEFGRGFTVVAREIRRLADQTAVATLDIDNMVKDMRGAVTTGVMEMDSFISNVAHSAEDIGRISHRVSRIIGKVQDVAPSLTQVGQAMSSLAEETQMTQDSLSESYSAIEQLNEAAKNLQSEVSRFKLVQKEPSNEKPR